MAKLSVVVMMCFIIIFMSGTVEMIKGSSMPMKYLRLSQTVSKGMTDSQNPEVEMMKASSSSISMPKKYSLLSSSPDLLGDIVDDSEYYDATSVYYDVSDADSTDLNKEEETVVITEDEEDQAEKYYSINLAESNQNSIYYDTIDNQVGGDDADTTTTTTHPEEEEDDDDESEEEELIAYLLADGNIMPTQSEEKSVTQVVDPAPQLISNDQEQVVSDDQEQPDSVNNRPDHISIGIDEDEDDDTSTVVAQDQVVQQQLQPNDPNNPDADCFVLCAPYCPTCFCCICDVFRCSIM